MEHSSLDAYAALVRRWNATVNLVSARDLATFERRHIEDCLQLVPLLPAGELADLGSGAGLPGLVVAMATGRHVHLVEADLRKCAFLREAVRDCHVSATIHPVRIEICGLRGLGGVMARALAPLSRLLGWAAPLLGPGGVCLFMKGRGVEAELGAAAELEVRRIASATDPHGCILRIEGLARG